MSGVPAEGPPSVAFFQSIFPVPRFTAYAVPLSSVTYTSAEVSAGEPGHGGGERARVQLSLPLVSLSE